MSRLRIAVLVPPEDPHAAADRADTLVQAAEINHSLTMLGNETLTISFGKDRAAVERGLAAMRPDLVVNLVEDLPEGPDQLHLVTELLDRLGLPSTGAPSAALRALADKRVMKRQLAAAGLPVPPGLGPWDATYIIKSAIEHASIGIGDDSVVSGRTAAEALIAEREDRLGGQWFAEAYIDGREFNLGLLETAQGVLPLPTAEILFLDHAERPKIIGYAEKWAEGSRAYAATPRRFSVDPADAALRAELTRLGLAAWQLFGLKGYARIDFRIDGKKSAYILEVNANPCLSADAGFCAAAAEIGLSQTDIVASLIETALA